MNAHHLDPRALLVALVLAPATYSRNRFFQLHADPEVRRVRRRAGQLRGLLRDLAVLDAGTRDALLSPPTEEGAAADELWLRYERVDLGVKRAVRLDLLELSLLRFVLGLQRAPTSEVAQGLAPLDVEQVEAALAALAPPALRGLATSGVEAS